MTIREIAAFAEVSTKTVRRWVDKLSREGGQNAISTEKLKMLEAGDHGRAVQFSQEEATAILQAGGRAFHASHLAQRAAGIPHSASEQPTQIVELVKALIPAMAEAFRLALGGHPAPTSPVPALEAPAMTPRHELRRLIARGMERFGGYREAWHELYAQAYYRLGRNIRLCAENRGMEPLDFAENEGLLPQLVAIAREVFA